MKYFAVARLRKEGIHKWDDAFEEVEFLQYPHRHEFHIEVKVEQIHNDRDVEFIELKRWLFDRIDDELTLSEDAGSCEMIAEDVIDLLDQRYDDRQIKVSVFEDGENGAEVISDASR